MTEQQAREDRLERPCTCHPDDALAPCPKQYALFHCQHEAILRGTHLLVPADYREAERKAIVEWLRKKAAEMFVFGDSDEGRKWGLEIAADEIEEREHLKGKE